jgi:WD40 repeat protein
MHDSVDRTVWLDVLRKRPRHIRRPAAVRALAVAAVLAAALDASALAGAPAGVMPDVAAPAAGGPRPARTDRLGDALPAGARFRLGSARLRHGTPVHSAAFAAEGAVLLAAGDDGLIRFWDPATGKELRHVRGGGMVVCTPDGKTVAAFDGDTVALWDVAAGRQLRKLAGRVVLRGAVRVRLALAPDGKAVAALGTDGSVLLWDVATGRRRLRIPAAGKGIVCLGFAAEGKRVVTTTYDREEGTTVRRWDTATGKELPETRISSPGGRTFHWPLAFSPDGATLVLGESAVVQRREGAVTRVFAEYRLVLADAATGRKRRRLDAATEVIWSAGFSADGRVVACQRMDGSVGAWDTASGKLRFDQPGYPGNGRPDGAGTLAFTPDGKQLATVGYSGAVHLWDAATGRELRADPEAHHGAVAALAFTPDGRTVATGSDDETIRLWDTATGRQRRRLVGHTAEIRALAFAGDGRMLASAGGDHTVRRWDPATGKALRPLKEERPPRGYLVGNGVRALGLRPDGATLITLGEDQVLREWDLAAGKMRATRRVVLRGLAESRSGDPARPAAAPPADPIRAAAFLPDGATALVASDKLIHLVEVAGGRQVFAFPSPSGLTCLALAPDGQTLVTASTNGAACLFEMATGKKVLQVSRPAGIGQVALSPDGGRVALAESYPGTTIHVLDVAAGAERARFRGKDAYVTALAFAPDGKSLASGLTDSTALLWELPAPAAGSAQGELAADRLDRLWADLAGSDAARAHQAVGTLTAHAPQAVDFLARHVRAAPSVDVQRLQALLTGLDDKRFAKREEATGALKQLGRGAEAALRAALQGSRSGEVRRRVKAILATPPPWAPQDAEALRRTRAIRVLEGIGSPAARRLLEKLAAGEPTATETRLASAARRRLTGR